MSAETWYVLEDDSVADPREVAVGDDGFLKHKDGRKVAYAPHGPRSRGVDPEAERAKAKPAPKPKVESKTEPKSEPKVESKDVKPEVLKGGYKTRETKAD